MSSSFLHQLVQSGQLISASSASYQQREQRGIDRLLSLPIRTYLQDYDLLFRHVSLWLSTQGYELTNKQPHLVLAKVCGQLAPRTSVGEVIRCRHALKYQGETPTGIAQAALATLLSVVAEARQQLLPLPEQPCSVRHAVDTGAERS